MPTLNELLAPQVIFDSVINRVKKVNNTLQKFWGLQMGTKNVEKIPGRVGTYDIFDNVRTVAGMRAPNAGPARIAARPVHQQPVTVARFYEAIPLYYERIFPLRQLGKPSTNIDKAGARYIALQEGILRTRFENSREWLMAGMMKGTCQVLVSGEDWIPVFTGGTHTIDWQIPAANKTTLNLTGGGAILSSDWEDVVNADIFTNVLDIGAAFFQIHGFPLRHCWLNSKVWSYVTNNAGLRARSGSSNVVFERWKGLGSKNESEYTDDEMVAEIRCLPGILWHIYDGGLELNGSFTKFFPDSGAGSTVFTPEPSEQMVSAIEGSEYIVEDETKQSAPTLVDGTHFYPMYHREPARIEVCGINLWMPALKIPKVVAVGTTV